MIVKTAARPGMNGNNIRMTPQGKAILRLVAPVAIESPTLPENVDWPIPPKRPAMVVPMEAAKIPPLTDLRSVRLHSRSFAFWQNVRSPTLLRVDARQAMKMPAVTLHRMTRRFRLGAAS